MIDRVFELYTVHGSHINAKIKGQGHVVIKCSVSVDIHASGMLCVKGCLCCLVCNHTLLHCSGSTVLTVTPNEKY